MDVVEDRMKNAGMSRCARASGSPWGRVLGETLGGSMHESNRSTGRGGWLLLLAPPVLGLACTASAPGPTPPSAGVVDTVEPPPREQESTAPSFDSDAGFDPPAKLMAEAPPLVVSVDRLTIPAGVEVERRRPAVVPWPEDIDLAPPHPRPPAPTSDRPCRRQHFLPHDVRPLLTVDFEYDAQGRVSRERVDDDTDGTIDFDHRYEWGTDGRPSRHVEQVGRQPSCDGPIRAHTLRHDYRYDRHGAWLGGEVVRDFMGDDVSSWHRTEYDGQGRPSRWIQYSMEVVERAVMLSWDDQGRLVQRVDYEGEVPKRMERLILREDERYRARWAEDQWSVVREVVDGAGRVVLEQHDRDGDGHVDERWTRTYDAQGREQYREVDTTGDGIADTRTELERDDQGRTIAEVTTGAAGESLQRWLYDEQGRLVRWSSTPADSWVEDFEAHVYDAAGHEVERTAEHYKSVSAVGDLSNYVEREHWEREFDEQGRLVRERVLQGELGPDERIEYVYACETKYRRHSRRNPLDHPETAAECMGFE